MEIIFMLSKKDKLIYLIIKMKSFFENQINLNIEAKVNTMINNFKIKLIRNILTKIKSIIIKSLIINY